MESLREKLIAAGLRPTPTRLGGSRKPARLRGALAKLSAPATGAAAVREEFAAALVRLGAKEAA